MFVFYVYFVFYVCITCCYGVSINDDDDYVMHRLMLQEWP